MEKNIFKIGITIVATIVAIILVYNCFESYDSDEILGMQGVSDGKMSWYVSGGIEWQGFRKVTVYKKRSIYVFLKNNNAAIKVRFNDAGHADMSGSIQYEMPLDTKQLTAIHVRFGNPEALKKQLIETVVNKAVYLIGPLMSSKESYAEKRNDLIFLVEDQIQNGVYKTRQKSEKQPDPITGQEKSVVITEIMKDTNDIFQRQEEGQLSKFGIKPFNFAINSLDYDETVEKQIKYQQELAMQIQTSIAEARQAEQRAITVSKTGEADAAKSKWEQEVIKAKVVTEAEQKLQVAELDAQQAEQEKIAKIRRAEGESEYKRKVMAADGALAQKLEAFVRINENYANAIKEYKGNWVPSVIMGNGGKQVGNGATDLINMLTAETALKLGIRMDVKGTKQTKQE